MPTHTADVTLNVNGEAHALHLDTRATLLDVLREQLGLTGSKKGCDHGQCGACTVLVDGRRANACLLLAVAHDGVEVTTVEGLADGDDLHPLQAAFVEHDAFQCGYCTPGQLCSAVGMIAEARDGWPSAVTPDLAGDPVLDDDEIRERMSGNLCRCGAYANIVPAIASLERPDADRRDLNAGLDARGRAGEARPFTGGRTPTDPFQDAGLDARRR
jgi:xanthine dehydrogenase YagT iron-sulfur-binding subunit